MRFLRYARGRLAPLGIDLTAERQEHHQSKYKTDGWKLGYMESMHDTRSAREVHEGYHLGPDFLVRGVTRRLLNLRIWIGWFTIEFTFCTPWKVDPNWNHLGGIETAWNEVGS